MGSSNGEYSNTCLSVNNKHRIEDGIKKYNTKLCCRNSYPKKM